jgi:transposase-like protein
MEGTEMSESTTTAVLSEQEWRRHFEAWKESGLNQSAYCREHGVGLHRFRYWRSKLEGRERRTGMVKVPVPLSSPAGCLEIVTGRYTIRIPEGFDEPTLERLLGIVEKR